MEETRALFDEIKQDLKRLRDTGDADIPENLQSHVQKRAHD